MFFLLHLVPPAYMEKRWENKFVPQNQFLGKALTLQPHQYILYPETFLFEKI